MLRINRKAQTLTSLEQRHLPEAGLKERDDIQKMIRQSPEAFFAEMGEELLLVGEEVRPTDFVDDRIDMLAIDKQGAGVVVELKRGSKKLQLLQSLAYASMVAKWKGSRFFEERAKLAAKTVEDAEEEIEQFLEIDTDGINQVQRLILLAEDYDYEVLTTAEWLDEKYGVDIRCYRLVLSADGQDEFLSCVCIYPPPELTQHAIRRKASAGKPLKWQTWDVALSDIANKSIVDFFRAELNAGRENYLRKRILRFRLAGTRRWNAAARKDRVYVWQSARFPNDEEFWKNRLGSDAQVSPVKDGKCLRFFLKVAEDFQTFIQAVGTELLNVKFSDGEDTPEELEGDE